MCEIRRFTGKTLSVFGVNRMLTPPKVGGIRNKRVNGFDADQ